MKRICLFCVLGIFLTACAFKVQDYPVIKDPNYPRVVVKEKEGKVVNENKLQEERTQAGIFYPDPTRILIENRTYNVFIRIWLVPSFEKGKVKGPPDLDLPPRAKVEAIMPLGQHPAYAQGRIKTADGWKSVGVISKNISIDSRVYYGSSYGEYVIFNQSDFLRR